MDANEAAQRSQAIFHRLVEARKSADEKHKERLIERALKDVLSLADGLASFLVQRRG